VVFHPSFISNVGADIICGISAGCRGQEKVASALSGVDANVAYWNGRRRLEVHEASGWRRY
jgi:hypothetical protein